MIDSGGSLSHPFYHGDPDQALQRFSWLKMNKQDYSCKKMFHTTHRSQSSWKEDFYFFLSMLCKVLMFPSFTSSLRRKKIAVLQVSGQSCFHVDLAKVGQGW